MPAKDTNREQSQRTRDALVKSARTLFAQKGYSGKGTEEIVEGGENRFIQKFPTQTKYPELILKRGLLRNSEVVKWIRKCVEELKIEPKSIDIKLLNEEHEPLLTWHVVNAYPTKWAVSDLNASSNEVVVESLQF